MSATVHALRDGGPAFPREDYQTDNAGGQQGMTLRDYFAAKAMAALMAAPMSGASGPDEARRMCARVAYQVADAMLAERAK